MVSKIAIYKSRNVLVVSGVGTGCESYSFILHRLGEKPSNPRYFIMSLSHIINGLEFELDTEEFKAIANAKDFFENLKPGSKVPQSFIEVGLCTQYNQFNTIQFGFFVYRLVDELNSLLKSLKEYEATNNSSQIVDVKKPFQNPNK